MRRHTIIITMLMACWMSKGIAGGIEHPAMLHSGTDISNIKANLSATPLSAAYAHLKQSQYAQTSYTEHTSALADGYLKRLDYNNWGPHGTYGQYTDYNNYTAAMRDVAAAYQLALRYRLSDDTQYAEAAVRVLNAWAANCKGILKKTGWTNNICDPNLYLILIQGYQFANAAELLRDYSGWDSADFATFQTWMQTTFCDLALLFLDNHHGNVGNMHYWLNWDLAALTTVLSTGILCDDQTLISKAVNYYKTASAETGYVRNAVPYLHQDPDSDEWLGQCQESGRDQGHATLCVSLLGIFCQMALNVGEDLFAYDDYRALRMAEYVGKYNLPTADTYHSDSKSFVYNNVPYTAYSNASYSNPSIGADSRGTLRPCWELFAAYARSHLQPARYCDAWVELMRAQTGYGSDGGAGDYGNGSGGFDQLGYGTLMYGWIPEGDYPARVNGVGYTTLNAACAAIASSGTVELYDDIAITATCDVQHKNISIVPMCEGITVSSALDNSLWVLNNQSDGVLTIGSDDYPLTIDGGHVSNSKNLLEAAEGSSTTIKNVRFVDCESTHNFGILAEKSNGKLYLNGVSFTDCTSPEGWGVVFAGSNEVYLQNTISFSGSSSNDIYLENRFLRIGDMTEPIAVISVKYQTPSLGAVILSSSTGGDKSAWFHLSETDYGIIKNPSHNTDHVITEASTQTITSAGAATLILPYEAKIPTGVKAYTLTYTGGNTVTATEVTGGALSANTPVLLNAVAGGYKFTNTAKVASVTTGSGTHTTGALTGVYQATIVPAGAYILTNRSGDIAFRKVDGTTNTVAACRCYLSADNASREVIFIDFGDATAIEKIDNGQFFPNEKCGGALPMGNYYDLQGRRVTQPKKGLYILNGKKILLF